MRKKLLISTLLLSLLFAFTSTFAYTQEIYKATPYYIHPVTGVIEDAGNNPGIGQGMTENVLNPQALVETTDDGRMFLSVRYSLANYIKNETFAVQNRGDKDFYSVPAEVTGQTKDTKDYRFEIPSANVIVRATFFVGPMGRDVVFYYDISNPTPGNTDFKTLEEANGTTNSPQVSQEAQEDLGNQEVENISPKKNSASNLQNSKNLVPVEGGSSVGEILPAANAGGKIEVKPVNSKFSAGDLGYKHGLLTKDSPQIKKLYYSDDKDQKAQEEKEKKSLGKITMAFIYLLLLIIGIITSIALIMAIASYLYYKKMENNLQTKRMEVYDEED